MISPNKIIMYCSKDSNILDSIFRMVFHCDRNGFRKLDKTVCGLSNLQTVASLKQHETGSEPKQTRIPIIKQEFP